MKFNEFLKEAMQKQTEVSMVFYGHKKDHNGQIYYDAIYSNSFGTKFHGDGQIYELTFQKAKDKEIDKNEIEYWGWLSDNHISMVFPTYFLFNMCFPSGAKHAEETGDGERIKMILVDVKPYTEKEKEEE
jgi:hypothetical protein